jgi:hypothetical protein
VRKQLYELSDVLLACLRLPNDLDEEVLPGREQGGSAIHAQHMKILRALGMTRGEGSPVFLVGKPVLLQRRLRESIATAWKCTGSFAVSPACMVRPAIVEATGLHASHGLEFYDSPEMPTMLLVGHGLHALLALFVRSMFVRSSNQWPIRLHSVGVSYRRSASNKTLFDAEQFMRLAAVDFCMDDASSRREMEARAGTMNSVLEQYGLDLVVDRQRAGDLLPFERSAICWRFANAVTIARMSRVGTYVSRRLNIRVGDTAVNTNYVHLNYYSVDLSALLGAIVEVHCAEGKDSGGLEKFL